MDDKIEFTNRELDIMAVLWDFGPATVAEVRERIPDKLAYTTVSTILRILEDKGYVDHVEEGRAHRYRPLVERAEAGESALRRLLGKVFRGSPALLVTHLVSDKDLSVEELRRMRDVLNQRLRKEQK